jgi:separase
MASSPVLDTKSVIEAIASPSSCTALTIANLQQLLNPSIANKPISNGKENPRSRTGRKPGTLAVATKLSAPKGRTQRKGPGTTTPGEDIPELSAKERLNLAFEAVNAALKSLSQSLKDRPAETKPKSPSKQPVRSSPVKSQKSTTDLKSRRPLKPRAPNDQKAASTTEEDSGEKAASPAQITAECARAALAHIREQSGPIGRNEKDFQVENGMLALIGKCVAHDMDVLAVKELRILRKRLAAYTSEDGESQGTQERPNRSRTTADQEKESVADLLQFEEVGQDSPIAQLVVGHQLHVVKLLVKMRRPRTIEAALKYLDMSFPSSPANILLHQGHSSHLRSKTARQLEILAQSLLSMCPSIATADDCVAINGRLSVAPEIAFQLQSLAFRIRISWWCLASHKPDVEKELWNPLSKSLTTFSRRATLPASKKYEMAASIVREIEAGLEICLRSIKTVPDPEGTKQLLPVIYRTLSQLAQAANLTSKAMELTTAILPSKVNSSSTGAVSAGRTIRLATIGVASKDGQSLLQKALETLSGNLNGDGPDMDSLLVEVAGFRRATLKFFQEDIKDRENTMPSSLGKLCCEAVFASNRFLVQYIGDSPSLSADNETIIRFREKLKIAEKVLKTFVESTFLCCKRCIPISAFPFDTFDSTLQDCCTLIKQLQRNDDPNDELAYKFHQELQFPYVRVSNNYYNLALQEHKTDGAASSLSILALRKSIEVLRGRTAMERGSGLLATKLERLSTVLYDTKQFEEAYRFIEETLQEHLTAGLLRSAAEEASTSSLHVLSGGKGPTSMLNRALRRSNQILLKIFREPNETETEVLDDEDLPLEERGLLLELQLHIAGQEVMGRNPDQAILSRVGYLIHTLFGIYSVEDFPIRRLRVAVFTSRLVTQHSSLLHDDLAIILDECTQQPNSLGQDTGLGHHFDHLYALLRVTLALRSLPVEVDMLKDSLATWKSLVDTAQDASTRIDDVSVWISHIGLISDFFELQGLWHQAILSLELLNRATKMLPTIDLSVLIKGLIRLAMNNLALGYSGRAGHTLEKARQYLDQDGVGPEVSLKWHIAHAEHLLAIGNVEKCGQTLAKSEAIAAASPEVLQTSGPGGTVSSRIRAKRLLADAAYVYSIYSLESGNPAAAFDFSRICCKLNQSVWTTMENQQSPSQGAATPAGTDTEVDKLTKSMNGLSTSMFAGRPVVVSTTHATLCGPTFWSLVPALLRGLHQLSTIYLHHGCFIEATHNALQAKKIADTVMSPFGIINCATLLASLYVRSGRVDKAQERFDEAAAVVEDSELTTEMVLYNSVAAMMWRAREEVEDEIECWDWTIHAVDKLVADASIGDAVTSKTAEDQLADKLASLQLQPAEKPKRVTKARGGAAKPVQQPRITKAAKLVVVSSSSTDECTPLLALRGNVLREKIAALLQSGDDTGINTLLDDAEKCQSSHEGRIKHATAKFRLLLTEATQQIASNLTFSALPESTIALPALARSERRSSHQLDSSNLPTAAAQRKAPAKNVKKAPAKKVAISKAAKGKDFAATLQAARDCLLGHHTISLRTSPIDTFRELSELLGASSILLSATEHILPRSFVHPLSTAFYLDLPSIHSSRLEDSVLRIENDLLFQKDKTLRWPSSSSPRFEDISLPSATQFNEEYIDILPESWTTISISLDQAKGELLLTRYRCGQSPLILRLPMARHQSRDLDEDVFDFAAGKREVQEIADLANFSAHDARDMSKKGAKTQWWAEREALDLRLKELLLNIENIWLGGFRGIFAQERCDPQALANFQSELLKTMGRHLPSRQGRAQPKAIKLDPRILELFTGLGDPNTDSVDLDEPLMDLMYFVVDILQFNGERNAYDEIDFDAVCISVHVAAREANIEQIVIEIIDALKVYHSSAEIDDEDRHTILILDKCLHGIPWESLPSLRDQSISRLPSLAALRQRILMIERSQDGVDEAQDGKFYASRSSGTSLLNPSGDLKNTQETMQPLLRSLPESWSHSLSAQDERGFSSLLSENEILLYFGHGCGSQYIRPRAVKKLALASSSERPTCATTWLMGCSSAVVQENGVFEPDGMALAYITAGSPAVVGTLWDVTDKDCDRASVKAGELWGLWDIPSESTSKVSKGKGKDVEKPRNGTVAARRKLFEEQQAVDVRMKRGVSPEPVKRRIDLSRAVARSREVCYLKYLNGAALVTYGIPVYLKE